MKIVRKSPKLVELGSLESGSVFVFEDTPLLPFISGPSGIGDDLKAYRDCLRPEDGHISRIASSTMVKPLPNAYLVIGE